MSLQQLSVFVENRPGSLVSVLKTLADAQIDLNGLSVADTTEFGVLRLILSDPAKGEEVLQEVFCFGRRFSGLKSPSFAIAGGDGALRLVIRQSRLQEASDCLLLLAAILPLKPTHSLT